jgi:hypothetical protein
MNDAAEFRKLARECLKWATAEADEAKRQALIETANMWTRAALHLEAPGFTEKTAPFTNRGGARELTNDTGA